ncbi:MAG: HDOD domain-containing protein [Bacteroidetes bacterium]|nr:HDOD domain-containing protein [Bacteroidota bacterium]
MQDIRSEIQKINEIIPIPSTVTLILSRSMQGEMANSKLIQLVDSDSVLTALVLRAANSAFYSIRAGVATVSHAVTMLGYTEVSRLVLTYELRQRIFTLDPQQRDFLNRLWLHSLCTATTARIIARYLRLSTGGEEFTAGLLHDMGKIVLAQHYSFSRLKVREMVEELFLSDLEAERQLFAMGHDEIGEYLGQNWRLPAVITDTMRYHHDPAFDGPHRIITSIVRTADLLAEQWNLGITERSTPVPVPEDPCWSVLTEQFPVLTEEPFETFEESVRMEFENNLAFSELFS